MSMTSEIPVIIPTTLSSPEAQLELWRNATNGRVLIKRFGADGRIRSDLVGAGKAFHLTPTERRHNQELAASPKLDLFANGTIQPVRLLEGEPDTQVILNNPNHIPEDDAKQVFILSDQQFKTRLESITNEAALQRLKELALDRSTRATVWQLRTIESRITKVAPVIDRISPETANTKSDGSEGHKPRAVSPR